ncbi:MAG: bifunctional phosphoglucose/phosphomannose isomerase [Candidatus Hodarchaeales archaeon]|jgi:glucose/mannose-6-phosphate isomerase
MNLDDLSKIAKMDTQNMFQMVFKWPELIEKLLRQSFDVPDQCTVGQYTISYLNSYSQILICGMGGSAVSGDYLRTYLEKVSTIPIIVQRNYSIPAYVDNRTLVILISYSGNTEETISCLIGSLMKSASIVGIGSGGKLEEFCRTYKIPFFSIPPGFQPRASFPLLFFPLIKILTSIGIVTIEQSDINDTISEFRRMRQEFHLDKPSTENPAKIIAQKIHGLIPIIWSPFGCVANRMKCQLNENSKILALSEELPEFNHNHIVGYESITKENSFIIIAYRFPDEHPNVKLRYEITKELIAEKVDIIEIKGIGTNLLTQLFSATFFGDYISMYLAILNNKDPSTVENINFLKKQLEQRGQTQTNLDYKLKNLIRI